MVEQAENEFRDAVSVDPGSAAAHAGLATAAGEEGRLPKALATEAADVGQLQPNVEALLVLARLDLKQNQVAAASSNVDRALALEPANSASLALKRDIAARPAPTATH